MFINDIEEQLTNYIDNSIYNYGFLIDGEWGVGKTYFINNIYKNAHEEKEIIYVSLNGVNQVEEIDIKVTETLIKDHLGKGKLKTITLKTVLSKEMPKQINYKNIINFLDKNYKGLLIDIILDTVTDILNKNNVVLVFDDIERCSVDNIEELLAYFNNYIEIQKMKVILIANESRMKNNEKYKMIKEKVIGHTVKFIPNLKDNYDYFIKNVKDIKAQKMLKNNVNNVLGEIKKQNHFNMRTLQFIIDKYSGIYNTVIKNSEYCDDTSINDLIIKYITFSSIMLKKGKEMNQWKDAQYGYVAIEENNYNIDNFRYGFRFIDQYIYYGTLEKEEIIKILKQYMFNVLPTDNPYSVLKNNYWEMEDDEIYSGVNAIYDNLINGIYKSYHILDIMLLLLKLKDRNYSIDFDAYLGLFKKIIKKDYENGTLAFEESFMNFFDTNEKIKNEFFQNVEKIKKYIAELHFKSLNKYVEEGKFNELFISLRSSDNYSFIVKNGFFCNINIETIVSTIKKKETKTIELMHFKYFCDKLIASTEYASILEKKELTYINKFISSLKEIKIENNISKSNALLTIIENLQNNTRVILNKNI